MGNKVLRLSGIPSVTTRPLDHRFRSWDRVRVWPTHWNTVSELKRLGFKDTDFWLCLLPWREHAIILQIPSVSQTSCHSRVIYNHRLSVWSVFFLPSLRNEYLEPLHSDSNMVHMALCLSPGFLPSPRSADPSSSLLLFDSSTRESTLTGIRREGRI